MMKQPAILFVPLTTLVMGGTHIAQNAIRVDASGFGGWGTGCGGSRYCPWSNQHRHRRRHFSHNSDFGGFDIWFNPNIFDTLQDMVRNDRNFEFLTKNGLPGRPNSTVKYSINEDRDTGVIDVTFEVPGIAAQDMSVELENKNVLHVQGRRQGQRSQSRSRTRSNRSRQVPTDRTTKEPQTSGSNGEEDDYLFDKTIMIGNDIDENTVTATLSNGILHVQLARKKKVFKSIPIIVMNDDPNPQSSSSRLAKQNIPFKDFNEDEDDNSSNNDNSDDEGSESTPFLERIGFPSRQL